MNKEYRVYYTIAFSEKENIGLVLFCPELSLLNFKFKKAPEDIVVKKAQDKIVKSLESDIKYYRSTSDLDRLIEFTDGAIKFTELKSLLVKNFFISFDELYKKEILGELK